MANYCRLSNVNGERELKKRTNFSDWSKGLSGSLDTILYPLANGQAAIAYEAGIFGLTAGQ